MTEEAVGDYLPCTNERVEHGEEDTVVPMTQQEVSALLPGTRLTARIAAILEPWGVHSASALSWDPIGQVGMCIFQKDRFQ